MTLGSKLSWTHYRKLSVIHQAKTRRAYLKAAEDKRWSVRDLTGAIKTKALEQATDATIHSVEGPQLQPRYGRIYTYRVMRSATSVRLDVGFGMHYTPMPKERQEIGAAEMVEVTKRESGDGYRFEAISADASRLYTYRADLVEVIDGDTFWVDIDYGFRMGGQQKLRLRAIDTPELSASAGVRVRQAVVEMLAPVSFVVLATSRTDKYDRYLADVFCLAGATTADEVLDHGVYLNQRLLDEGLAGKW